MVRATASPTGHRPLTRRLAAVLLPLALCLAGLLKDVLGRFDALFDQPLPYMLTCHQAPVRRDRDLAHVHLEAFSVRRTATKLKYLASSESGAGVFINDIAPEQAAELLRAATPVRAEPDSPVAAGVSARKGLFPTGSITK